MKGNKKTKINWGAIPALLVSAMLTFGCSGGGASTDDITVYDPGPCPPQPTTPGDGGGVGGNGHSLTDSYNGGCATEFFYNRGIVGASARGAGLGTVHIIHAEEAYDEAAWDSWNERGGNYHNDASFTILGEGGEVAYSVNINGNPKAPCFNWEDISKGNSAASNKIATCKAEIDADMAALLEQQGK